MRAGGSGPCESAVLQSGSVDDLTLKGGGGDREKKKKTWLKHPGALTRDVMPGYRDVAHGGRHRHARAEKEKATESRAERARPAMFHASALHVRAG